MANILIVDDQANVRTAVMQLLLSCNRTDLNVDQTTNGTEALRRLQSKKYDLLISDTDMPGMNGAEFIGRAREAAGGIPVVLATGYADMAEVGRVLGTQRILEIARALAADPMLLVLDEPAAGLNPQEKKDLQQLIGRLRDEYGVTILLIEHDMGLVMGVSERILVMEYGRPIAVGLPEEIQNNEQVIKAYLGEA